MQYHYQAQKRREMLAFVPESCKVILEVGCGDGSFGEQLRLERNAQVWGVELNPEVASVARKKLDKVLCGDLLELLKDLPAGYFDCIICNDILEHFVHTGSLIGELKNLLKPGGYITSSLPNFRYVGNLWEILVKKDFEYKNSGILDYTHYRFFTQKSIVRMFSNLGFTIIKSEGVNPTPSVKVKLFNLIFFNHFPDIPYMQIATLAQLK
jgi:2-polyprenyl-3-methyl-5-hydroxy-6-metoxy-1,4-benzoquinol methylase